MNELNSHCMMMISKYFKTVHDYINIVKCCKEYSNTISQYKYNPIPLKNEKEREIFNNIDVYHFYNEKEEEEIKILKTDKRIKEYIHWERVYPDMINEDSKHKYKNLIETKEKKKGICGNEIKYILYENGGMIISGNGNMKNYENDHENEREWHEEKDNIKEIIIENGIKSIGDNCFYQCSNLKNNKHSNKYFIYWRMVFWLLFKIQITQLLYLYRVLVLYYDKILACCKSTVQKMIIIEHDQPMLSNYSSNKMRYA